MPLSIRYADSQQVVATCGPLIMRIIERARTDIEDVELMYELLDEARRNRLVPAVMVVVHHGAPIPAPHVLRYMAAGIPRLGSAAVMFTMLGLGFWAQTTQCALLRLSQLAGMRVPVATDLDSAAARLSRRTPSLDVATVISAYEGAARKMLIGAGTRSGSILA